MRHLALALFFVSTPALAGDASTEAQQAWDEVQRSSSEALASQDCRVACRALESLNRATKRLCDIGPEHCAEARAKLRDATQRVRTSCPECEVQTFDQPKAGTTNVPPEPPANVARGGYDADRTSEAAPQKSGGCASCNASSADPGAVGLFALAFFLIRRKSKRRL